jgi:hypothetical protein
MSMRPSPTVGVISKFLISNSQSYNHKEAIKKLALIFSEGNRKEQSKVRPKRRKEQNLRRIKVAILLFDL